MKYRGHETFSIRKNWIAKGMMAINEHQDIFTSKELDATVELGIGRNMVFSLRYWLKAIGLTQEIRTANKKTKTQFTDFGSIIFQHDKYIEETGTLWFLQYQLSKNKDNATAWYYFFNEFNMSEFSKDDFVQSLKNFDRMNGGTTALRSFEDDFECIKNTYISRFKTITSTDPEDNIESPFAELVLLETIGSSRNTYRKVIPPKQDIPPIVLLAVIKAEAENSSKMNEILISDIQNKKCNVGKVFNLDTITLMDILSILENRDLIKIVRTAGLDVINILTKKNSLELLCEYYAELAK